MAPVDSTSSATATSGVTTSMPASSVVPTNHDVPALGECPSAVFPDLSAVAGPGADYAMPVVAVQCTDTEVVVTSNGMPGYEFVPMTPNGLQEQT